MTTPTTYSPDKARILHYQRLSTEDGPGIRTTIFFKGCPLHCEWCHNPESISPKSQLQWLDKRCISCHICLDTCPENALADNGNGLLINRDLCTGCGRCAKECPSNALEILGSTTRFDDCLKELRKDKQYYDTSGGGVTASGGEPAIQADFVANVFTALREMGIQTALDTCGACRPDQLEKLLLVSDMVLFDIKHIDPDLHRRYTGRSNIPIFENLSLIAEYMEQHPGALRLWIRTPLIPGSTATRNNISGIGKHIASHLDDKVERWELCAFNNLCADKYDRLDMEWPYAGSSLLTKDELAEFNSIAKNSGVNPDIVVVTGSSRTETD